MKPISTSDKWILWGIPVLFLLGGLFHFLYDFTGSPAIVGWFTPVNESLFEHLKMVPLPSLLWWGIGFLCQRKARPDAKRWFTAALVSLVTALPLIPLLFCFYTRAFGIESVWVDILILLLAVTAGQVLGLHVFRRGEGMDWRLALGGILAVLFVFALWTVFPPHLPFFLDPVSGGYGMAKAF